MATQDPELPGACPNCGKPADEWTENEGNGVVSGGLTYCSEACALSEAARQQED